MGLVFDKGIKIVQCGKNSLSNECYCKDQISTCKITKFDLYLTPYTKINSKKPVKNNHELDHSICMEYSEETFIQTESKLMVAWVYSRLG